MKLSIGIVLGGGELKGIRAEIALTQFLRAVRTASGLEAAETEVSLNIVYYVAGSRFSPEFTGARSARLSRAKRKLMVQVAVAADHV